MMTNIRAAVLMLMFILTAACASAPEADMSAMPPPAPYKLGPGDEVRIIVYGLPTLSNDYVVSDSGLISIPLLDSTIAKGKQLDELEADVARAIIAKQLVNGPNVSIQVQKYRPFFIMGEVQRPGQYPFVPGMSVLTAVSIAGGYTFRADTAKASIMRTMDQKSVKHGARQETLVMPDDTIQIPEGWF
jgi:protein involved in polysaccharide export with SLBB domain